MVSSLVLKEKEKKNYYTALKSNCFSKSMKKILIIKLKDLIEYFLLYSELLF